MTGSRVVILELTALVVVVTVRATVIQDTGCSLSINYTNGDLNEPQPLILISHKMGSLGFLNPINPKGILKISTNESLTIACPGTSNHFNGIPDLKNHNEIQAICIAKKLFIHDSITFDFSTITCKYLPKHVALVTKSKCHVNATAIKIGFKLKSTFLPTIDICWNPKTMMTHWTKFRLTPKINGYQSNFPRPKKWQSNDFYGNHDINYQYKIKTQMKTLTVILGSEKLAKIYINGNTKLFMARGHLTAKADFVYGAAQLSTFWYPNAAPQWQSFNAGNWNILENNIRDFVATRHKDLDIFTGIYGQMSLKDINGNDVSIYLLANGTARAFPVPKFFWKIIYDPSEKKGTAFVGTNDPWIEKITRDIFICKDIAHKIKWLTWQANDIKKGVSYACEVDELRKIVPTVPFLKINGILG